MPSQNFASTCFVGVYRARDSLAMQALHALLKTLDAALAPVPGLSKHNYGVSQHGFCVSAGLTGRCDDHAAAALDAALRLQEAARQVFACSFARSGCICSTWSAMALQLRASY